MTARTPALLRVLALGYAAEFVLLAWAPVSRADWALENALSVALVALLALSHRALPLSRLSYLLIFAFLTLHEIGAHYTYSLVPYDALSRRLFGASIDQTFGFERARTRPNSSREKTSGQRGSPSGIRDRKRMTGSGSTSRR